MKAIRLVDINKLLLCDLPSRALREYEVRVKVMASGVCGSDLRNFKSASIAPQIPGHEFSGIIVEVRDDSGTLRVGDRVTAFPMFGCCECTNCLEKNFRDCSSKKSLGFDIPGSFAQEVIIDSRFVVLLSDKISFEEGALVEHLSCGYRLAKEILTKYPDQETQITIIGDGAIALADLQSLKALGYTNLTLLGKHPNRMKFAENLGAKILSEPQINKYFRTTVCIFAAPAEKLLHLIIQNMEADSVVYEQSRILDPKIRESIKFQAVNLERAFAYEIQDFLEVMTWMESGKISLHSLVDLRIKLEELPTKFPLLLKKDSYIKALILS